MKPTTFPTLEKIEPNGRISQTTNKIGLVLHLLTMSSALHLKIGQEAKHTSETKCGVDCLYQLSKLWTVKSGVRCWPLAFF